MPGDQIFEDLKAGKHENIACLVLEHVKSVFEGSSLAEAVSAEYGLFSIKFLHNSISHLASPRQPSTLLEAVYICVNCFLKTKANIKLSEPLTVYKVLYHILIKLPHKGYYSDILKIADYLYNEIQLADEVLISLAAIVSNSYSTLWNIAVKLEQDAEFSDFSQTLKLRHVALKFFLMKENHVPNMVQKFLLALNRHDQLLSKNEKTKVGANTFRLQLELCREIWTLILKHISSCDNEKALVSFSLDIFLYKCKNLVNFKSVDQLKVAIAELKQLETECGTGNRCGIIDCISKISHFICDLLDKKGNDQKFLDSLMTIELQSISPVEGLNTHTVSILKDLYMLVLSQIKLCIDSPGTTHQGDCNLRSAIGTLKKFIKCCLHHLTGGSVKDNEGKLEAQLTKTLCDFIHTELQFMYKWIQKIKDESSMCEVAEKILATVLEHGAMINKQDLLPEKLVDQERYFCGYLMLKIGQSFLNKGLEKMAIQFYSTACQQLTIWCSYGSTIKQRCKEINLCKVYECLADCLRRNGDLHAAMETVVNCLLVDGSNVNSIIKIWVRAKKELLKTEPQISSRTLYTAIQQKEPDFSGVEPVFLLQSELTTIKAGKRKWHDLEYGVLMDLLTVTNTPLDRGKALVDIIQLLWLSGHQSQRSIEAYLGDALTLLSNNLSTEVKYLLADVHMWQYIIKHEKICQQLKDSTVLNTNKSAAAPGEEVEHGVIETMTTVYTLAEEMEALTDLTEAVSLWQEYCTETHLEERRAECEVLLHSLLLCSSVFRLLRQPLYELHTLVLAEKIYRCHDELQPTIDITSQIARVLTMFGKYKEASDLAGDIGSVTDVTELTASHVTAMLIKSEIYLKIGQVCEGMQLLKIVLDWDEQHQYKNKNISMCQIEGSAKYLASLYLRIPGQHAAFNEGCLLMAHEAVRMHTGVVHFLLGSKDSTATEGNTAEKWNVLHELLSSLLNLGQLYRHVGEAREAKCYLREGWKLSHAMGLPSWCLEFLLELTRLQILGGAYEDALKTSRDIHRILEDKNNDDTCTEYVTDAKSVRKTNPCMKLDFSSENSESNTALEMETSFNLADDEIKSLIPRRLNKSRNNIPLQEHNRFVYEQCFVFVLAELLFMLDFKELCETLAMEVGTSILKDFTFNQILKTVDNLIANTHKVRLKKKNKTENGYKNVKSLTLESKLKQVYIESLCLQAEVALVVEALPRCLDVVKTGLSFVQSQFQDNIHLCFMEGQLHFYNILAEIMGQNKKEKQLRKHKARNSVDEVVEHLERMKIENEGNSDSESDVMISDSPTDKMLLLSSQKAKDLKSCQGKNDMDQMFTTPVRHILVDQEQLHTGCTSNKLERAENHVKQTKPVKSPDLFEEPAEDDIKVCKRGRRGGKSTGRGRGKYGRGRGKGRGLSDSSSTSHTITVQSDPYLLEQDSDIETEIVTATSVSRGARGAGIGTSKIPKRVTKKDSEKISKPVRGRSKAKNVTATQSNGIEIETVRLCEEPLNCQNKLPEMDVYEFDEIGLKTARSKAKVSLKNRRQVTTVINTKESSKNYLQTDCTNENVKLRKGQSNKLGNKNDLSNKTEDDGSDSSKEKQKLKCKGQAKQLRTLNELQKERIRNKELSPEKSMNSTCDWSLEIINPRTPESPQKLDFTKSADLNGNSICMKFSELKFSSPHSLEQTDCQSCSSLHEDFEICPVNCIPSSACWPGIENTHEVLSPVFSNDTRHSSIWKDQTDCDCELTLNDSVEVIRGGSEKEPKSRRGRGRAAKSQRKTENIDGGNDKEQSREAEITREQHITLLTDTIDVANITGVSREEIILTLEKVYGQICQFPPCPLYSQLCKVLAVQYLPESPDTAAFYLSEAMSVTFRHQSVFNVGKKIRKVSKNQISRQNENEDEEVPCSAEFLTEDIQMMVNMRNSMAFPKAKDHLTEMLKSLPQGWTVCQVSHVDLVHKSSQIIITRFQAGKVPIIVQLPGIHTYQGRTVLPDFDSLMAASADSMKVTDKIQWWKMRRDLNDQMQNFLENMEKFWLNHWKGVLLGTVEDKPSTGCKYKEFQKISKTCVNKDLFEVLMNSAHLLSDEEVTRILTELTGLEGGPVGESMLKSVRSWSLDIQTDTRNPVILILDKSLQHLPWESLPVLRSSTVSRLPSIYHLHSQLAFLHRHRNSVYNRGVDLYSSYYILNPDNNLPSTQQSFQNWFSSEPGWKGIVGQIPTPEQFTQALTAHDLLVYCGHGSGSKYLPGDTLQQLRCHAAAILMGCSSGQLQAKGRLEASGMILNYFLAGCPTVVANLWDVTDKDIDRFLECLLKTWLQLPEKTSALLAAIPNCRQACKLPYLIGAAPVVYGLPVHIRHGT
ncbi:hypothetical protein ScPMuIL_012271 [Solemya velum]